jgi:hypothetical protein
MVGGTGFSSRALTPTGRKDTDPIRHSQEKGHMLLFNQRGDRVLFFCPPDKCRRDILKPWSCSRCSLCSSACSDFLLRTLCGPGTPHPTHSMRDNRVPHTRRTILIRLYNIIFMEIFFYSTDWHRLIISRTALNTRLTTTGHTNSATMLRLLTTSLAVLYFSTLPERVPLMATPISIKVS